MIPVTSLSMFTIFFEFLFEGLDSAWAEVLDPMQNYFSTLIQISMQIEKVGTLWNVQNSITAAAIDNAYTFMYATMCGLMILAFAYKGWMVYVVWRDGDSDVSPQTMLMGAGGAIVTAIAFPFLYDILCDVALYIGNGIIDRFQMSSLLENYTIQLAGTEAILSLILAIIFFVLMVVIYCQLLARGVELLILRLGFPIACLGMINSDSGIFKQYTGIFFRQAAMSSIQMVCLLLGLATMTEASVVNGIIAVSFEMCALSGPKIMSQLLPASGGGGGTRAISTMWMLKQVLPFGR